MKIFCTRAVLLVALIALALAIASCGGSGSTPVAPAITWATPSAITYGTALSSTQLDASTSAPGILTYSPVAGTVLTAGTYTLTVTFAPTDATKFTSGTSTVSLTVNQATPAITWAAPAAVNVGTALSATQLNATTTVPGTFTYTPALGTVLATPGANTLSLTFTPTDAKDYAAVTTTESITVNFNPQSACLAMPDFNIPASAIGLPTLGATVLSTTWVPGAAAVSTTAPKNYEVDSSLTATVSFCEVLGAIHSVDPAAEDIHFEVNLPAVWNGKAEQQGGGGSDGSVVSGLASATSAGGVTFWPVTTPAAAGGAQKLGIASPIGQGYVTLGSDSGHTTPPAGGFSQVWGMNAEQLANFGGLQVKKTKDTAVALMKNFYGVGPKDFYFVGGSQGGHEALVAAQWYPNDYNGVLVQFPAYDITLMHMGSNIFSKALYADNGYGLGGSWISPGQMQLIYNYVLATCANLDGAPAVDFVRNVDACVPLTQNLLNKIDLPATGGNPLRCPGGINTAAQGTALGDSCLGDGQITALGIIAAPWSAPFPLADGKQTYPKWPIIEGGSFGASNQLCVAAGGTKCAISGNNLGSTAAYHQPPAPTDAFQLQPSTGTIQGLITENLNLDTILNFNIATQTQYWPRLVQLTSLIDANNPDLTEFMIKGGKVIMAFGRADDSISAWNSPDYYNAVVSFFGQATTDSFFKYYSIPGMGHGSGNFVPNWDALGALDSWVNGGAAPTNITPALSPNGAYMIGGDRNANLAVTLGRSLPVCQWPQYPKYTGPASPTQAQINNGLNYTCTAKGQ